MSIPAPAQLHELNTPRAITLEPTRWEANLAALHRQQPKLADKLAEIQVPKHWQPCVALDDWATWRVEQKDAPPCWLGDSALPFKRAEALLLTFDPGELNASLPGIGTGAEVRLLLDRLPAYKAVYVFEDTLEPLAAVLRLHDFSAAIDAWRLIPIDLASAEVDLDRLLVAEPGLLPPGNIVGLPQHSTEQLQRVQAICQSLVQRVISEREARLSQLLASLPAANEKAGVMLIGFQYSPLVEHAARLWQSAAEQAGTPVDVHLLKTPRKAHLLALAEQLDAFGPARIVCLDHDIDRLPAALQSRARGWFLQAESVPTTLNGPTYAASPHIGERLSNAGAEHRPCFWSRPRDLTPANVVADGAVVLLDDLPSSEPASYGVQQPTQRRIFAALLEVLRRAWQAQHTVPPAGHLRSAEQLAQLELTDRELRERLLELIPRVLFPAIARGELATELAQVGRGVVGCGSGWNRLSQAKIENADVALRWLRQTEHPIAAAISIRPADPLDPALLIAVARGIPLWIYDPPRSLIQDKLAGLLRREEHYRPLSGQATAGESLEELRQRWPEVTRRAKRAQSVLGDMQLPSW